MLVVMENMLLVHPPTPPSPSFYVVHTWPLAAQGFRAVCGDAACKKEQTRCAVNKDENSVD